MKKEKFMNDSGSINSLDQALAIIEEQRQTIHRLKLRKEQYDSIMENMTELVERTAPDFSLIYVNNALCAFYDCTPGDLLGEDTMDLVFDDDKEKIYEMMKGVSADNPSYSYEYRVKKKDGSIVWMESVGRGFYDENGNILEYQDVGRDITRFKNMEEELKHQVAQRTKELAGANKELVSVNLYLQNILSGISEGVIIVNDKGDCKFLNYGPNDIWKDKQRVLEEFFRENILAKESNALNRLTVKNQSFTDVEMHCYSSKGILSFVASGVPLVADGDIVTEAILVLRPITEVHNMINRMSGAQARFTFKDIVTNSMVLQDAIFLAKQAAASDCNILIEGESGTGKEMFAQSIHNSSNRRRGPFVAVNCGAIPRELIASELFGYAEGAFTGAKRGGKPGKFELANGGTILLDEIGDMPMEQQIALLRVLQERRVTRVGGDREIPVDVRVICATNRNLLTEVMEKNFREDLYYRLNVINFRIPPLKERKEDILLLFNTFLMKNFSAEKALELIDPSVLESLVKYDWPGNVRELQNVAERMLYLSGGESITCKYLPQHIIDACQNSSMKPEDLAPVNNLPIMPVVDPAPHDVKSVTIADIRKTEKEQKLKDEKSHLTAALSQCHGNVSAAARMLGISRATFYRKLKSAKGDENS